MTEIKVLSDVAHARLRTEMYLGSRSPSIHIFPYVNPINGHVSFKAYEIIPAVLTAFREALDNALDEMSFVGKGRITVSYNEKESVFTIQDNGRGIPIDFRDDVKMHSATLAVSHTKAGRNFGERGMQAGTNGLGISIVNYVSEYFFLDIIRDKKNFTQTFFINDEGDQLVIREPVIKKAPEKWETGTKVHFKLDEKVFNQGLLLPEELVYSMLVLVAKSNPEIDFEFNGQAIKSSKKSIKESIYGKSQVIEVPFETDGIGRGVFFIRKTEVQSVDFSFVNNVPAYNGGTHMQEFRSSLPKHIIEALKKESKRRKLNPTRSDILDAVDILAFVKMNGPNFDSQSKTRLTNTEIKTPITHGMNAMDWEKVLKSNSEIVDEIYRLCEIRSGNKDKSKVDENAKALKKAKISKLVDANSRIRDNCVLFLAEGDSAAGGMASVRDPNIHAMLPLRGKIKNVHEVSASEIIGEKESVVKDMCAAIGLIPGKKVDRSQLRYSKVYLMADADDDGQGSICPLLVNFFYRFWPELFEGSKPFLHIFMTPLIILNKGNERKYFYPTNADEYKPEDWKGWEFKRAKGLASMQPVNFKDHIDNPLSIPVIEDGSGTVKKLMSLLFNSKRADDRKTMLEISEEALMERLVSMGSDWSPTGVNELDI